MSNLTQFTMGVPTVRRVFTSSTTFTPTKNIIANIYVVGGGAGGSAYQSYGGGPAGGGGGCAIGINIPLSSSVTYTVTVGAAGGGSYCLAGVYGDSGGGSGGSSSFSGSGITTLTGNGGSAAGTGGSASGGTVNYTGAAGNGANNGGLNGFYGTQNTSAYNQAGIPSGGAAAFRYYIGGNDIYLSNSAGNASGIGWGWVGSVNGYVGAGSGGAGCGGGSATNSYYNRGCGGGGGGAGFVVIDANGM